MRWLESTIGEICNAGGGEVKTGPFGSQLHRSDYGKDGIPVIMPKDIIDGVISENSIARVGHAHVDRLSQHKLSIGDIVYGRRGDIGRQALVRPNNAGWLCGTGCLRITLGDSPVIPEFLHLYLRQLDVIEWIAKQAVGATMPNLNTAILRSIPVKYPQDKAIQKKLTDAVMVYDNLIKNNNRRIVILEEMAQSLYREWFVKFRFPGHENTKFIDSPVGKIPEGWAIKPLKDVCHLTMGQSPKSEFYNEDGNGLPFFQGVKDFGQRFPSVRIWCSQPTRLAEKGDVLFSVRAPVGRLNIADQNIAIGRGLSAIRHSMGHQSFLFQQLKAIFTSEDMIGNGAIFASVTKKDMQDIKLLCPCHSVEKHFCNVIDPVFDLLGNLSVKNINLKEQRDLLLPKLISGSIEIR